jgi:hypothetical protein
MPDLRDEVLALPVDVKLMLNGDARADFLNHQKGKAVDKAHLFSLSVRAQDAPKDQEFAWQVARLLLTGQESPFHNSIRLDSKAMQGIPVSTLCASGSTDQGTSLVGLAKLALANGRSPEWAAGIVTLVHGHLKDRAPELLEPGRALAPPPNAQPRVGHPAGRGVRGVAFWLNHRAEDVPGRTWSRPSRSPPRPPGSTVRWGGRSLSAQGKRTLLNEFCSYLFHGWDGMTGGVPDALLAALGHSAYGVKRARKRKTVVAN